MTMQFRILGPLALLSFLAPAATLACQPAALLPLSHIFPTTVAWQTMAVAPHYRLVVEARTPEGAVQHYSDRWVVGTSAMLDLSTAGRTVLRVAAMAALGGRACDAADGRAYLPLAATALLDHSEHCPAPRLLRLPTTHLHSLHWQPPAQATALLLEVWSAAGQRLHEERLAGTHATWLLQTPVAAKTVSVTALCGGLRSRPALAIVPGG